MGEATAAGTTTTAGDPTGSTTAAVVRLAADLGWRGSPAGEDAAAFALLLDDELERLPAAARTAFVERLRASCPEAIGVLILECGRCGHLLLERFRAEDGRCRLCGVADPASAGGARGSLASG